jgi:N-acetylglucosaminyl-diphospho-decaprenol L-rhamnosyltransferase
MSNLDIILVNWNAGVLLRNCLESICLCDRSGFELRRVVVVDNASSDGSCDALDDFPLPMTIIRNHDNRGFAAACNQGAKDSPATYLLFLNPDTSLQKDTLKVVLEWAERPKNTHVGIIGIRLLDTNGRVMSTFGRFPTVGMLCLRALGLHNLSLRLLREQLMLRDSRAEREVDHVMGAFFLVRKTLFDDLGGFDENFFLYWEEVDFARRASLVKSTTIYLPSAVAYHVGGGCSRHAKPQRLFCELRSRILYAAKHFNSPQTVGILLGIVIVEPVVRLAWSVSRVSADAVRDTCRAYFIFWKQLPMLLKVVWAWRRA